MFHNPTDHKKKKNDCFHLNGVIEELTNIDSYQGRQKKVHNLTPKIIKVERVTSKEEVTLMG
jgi:hypothetical protein